MSVPTERDFLQRFLSEEPLLRAFLQSATGRLDVTDDLLQTVAATLWEKREQFDPSRPFRPWALGMARLEVLKWRQRLARSHEVLGEEALSCLAKAAVEHAEEIDRRRHYLQDCLGEVAGLPRRVLEMKYGHGERIGAIADQLGRTAGSIEMTLVRVRRALRDCVERKLAEESGDAG